MCVFLCVCLCVCVCEKMRGWWLLQEGWGGGMCAALFGGGGMVWERKWGGEGMGLWEGRGFEEVKVAREGGMGFSSTPPFFLVENGKGFWKVSACTVVPRCVAYVSR